MMLRTAEALTAVPLHGTHGTPDILTVRGSIASWLLDLTAIALFGHDDLSKFSGRVSDSGDGRWTITAAIDEGAP